MITEQTERIRNQIQMVSIDELVPQDHLLRIIDKAIDWSFIYLVILLVAQRIRFGQNLELKAR